MEGTGAGMLPTATAVVNGNSVVKVSRRGEAQDKDEQCNILSLKAEEKMFGGTGNTRSRSKTHQVYAGCPPRCCS